MSEQTERPHLSTSVGNSIQEQLNEIRRSLFALVVIAFGIFWLLTRWAFREGL